MESYVDLTDDYVEIKPVGFEPGLPTITYLPLNHSAMYDSSY